jgi:alpha-1,6-mannosyltransferase
MGTFRLPTTWSLPIAGFGGAAVLVLATSGLPLPPVVLLTVGLTGMGVVVLAWLGLGRHAADLPVRELYRIAVAWCAPLLLARPLFSGDLHSYLAQGVIAAEGVDPYRFGAAAALGADSPVTQRVSEYWQDTPTPYGPVWVAISRTIARVAGDNLPVTLLLNRLVELAGVVLIAWALPRLARRVGVAPGVALWLGLLNPLVLWHVVAGAHNDGLMVGLMLAGVELVLRGVAAPAGLVLLTVAANVKIVAAVAICCAGAELARRSGRTVGHGVVVLLGLLAGFAVLSVAIAAVSGLGLGWVGTLGASAQLHSWLAPTNQLGFLVGALGGADLISAAISVTVRIGAVLGAAAGAAVLWAIFRGRVNPVAGLGLAFAVMVVTGPVVQPWYLLWAIPPLAAGLRTDRARRPLVVVSAVSAMLLPPVGGGVLVLVAGYLGAAVPFAVMTGTRRLGRTWRPGRRTPESGRSGGSRPAQARAPRASAGMAVTGSARRA